jgi:hypothetical protein
LWARARELSGASLALLAFTLLSALAAVVSSHNPDLLLYKDAMATGLIGLIFPGSLLFPRPLAFYFGRYATDGTHVGIEAWRQMWQYRAFRQAQYAITAAWAVVYVIEAAAVAYVIHSNGVTAAYTATQVLPWTATGDGGRTDYRARPALSPRRLGVLLMLVCDELASSCPARRRPAARGQATCSRLNAPCATRRRCRALDRGRCHGRLVRSFFPS